MVEQFPIVLRGYDKERVDEAFASAQETVDRLREQVKADDQTILELQAQLQEEKNKKANPNSFASLGANAQQMLASAEQTSAELLDRAKKDASAAQSDRDSRLEPLHRQQPELPRAGSVDRMEQRRHLQRSEGIHPVCGRQRRVHLR